MWNSIVPRRGGHATPEANSVGSRNAIGAHKLGREHTHDRGEHSPCRRFRDRVCCSCTSRLFSRRPATETGNRKNRTCTQFTTAGGIGAGRRDDARAYPSGRRINRETR